MKIKISELLKTLDIMKLGVSFSENIEQANHFVFQDEKIFTFNNEMVLVADSPMDIEGAVIAKEFLEILGKFSADDATVEHDDNMLYLSSKMKGRKTKAGLSFSEDITLPLSEAGDLDDFEWKKLPKDFAEALKVVSPNASKDTSTSILQCVHIKGKVVEATDNFNIVRFETAKKVKEMNLFYGSAAKLSRFKLKQYCIQPSWTFFKTAEGVIIGSRNFEDGDYPNLSKFFKKFKGKKVELSKKLDESLKKAEIFLNGAEGDDNITLSVRKGWAKVSAEGTFGFVEEKVKVGKDVREFEIDVSLPQLNYLLNQSAEIEFGESTARIKSEKSTYICALR